MFLLCVRSVSYIDREIGANMRRLLYFLYPIAVLLLLQFASCDHGLDPARETVRPGFDGTVTFAEEWSEESGVLEVYVVVFKDIPKDSADAVNQFFIGNIRFRELTPPYLDAYYYSFDIDPGTYELTICVGVRGTQFFDLSNWVLSGVYSETNNPFNPSALIIPDEERVANVDISASVVHTLPLPF